MIVQILAAVLNSLWQAAIVAILVWASLRFLPRIKIYVNAATRYVIWWAALVMILLLPIAPRILENLRAPAQPIHSPTARSVSPPNLRAPVIPDAPFILTVGDRRTARWPLLVLALWAAVFLYRTLQIVRSYFYLRGVKRSASLSRRPLPAIARPITLLLSNEISSPMAVGFLRPAVILPESLPGELAQAELEHVLLHETAHISRYDDWTNLAARLLGAAFALHPLAIWILWQIEREREMACDDWVVARIGAARPYAASLARMFELRRSRGSEAPGLKLASGIFGSGSRTVERIENLLKRRSAFRPQVSLFRIAAGLLLLLTLAVADSFAPRWIIFAQKPAFAQQPDPRAFEVTSVKLNTGESQRSTWGFPPHSAGFTATNVNLKTLIRLAYKIKDSQIQGGAGWIDSERYDVAGKPPEGEPGLEPSRVMLRTLLHDRFKLTIHREMKPIPVYELMAAGNGLKLPQPQRTNCVDPFTASPGNQPPCRGFLQGPGFLTSAETSTAELADVLGNILDRPVVDKTEHPGTFYMRLEFAPDTIASPSTDGPDSDTSRPSLFTALQDNLGLKLESRKDPAEVIVIDHAEKPDAN